MHKGEYFAMILDAGPHSFSWTEFSKNALFKTDAVGEIMASAVLGSV
jgi:hypothetical protein